MTLSNTPAIITLSVHDLLHTFPVSHFIYFHVFLIYFPKCPIFSNIQSYAPNFLPWNGVQFEGDKSILLDGFCFQYGNPGFYFILQTFQTNQIFEIFYILNPFLFYHNLFCGWKPQDSHWRRFIHFHFIFN